MKCNAYLPVDEFSEFKFRSIHNSCQSLIFVSRSIKITGSSKPGDYAHSGLDDFNDLLTWSVPAVSSGGGNKVNSVTKIVRLMKRNGCSYVEVQTEVFRYANDIRYQISQLPEEEKSDS
ncbi:hypothetical protein NXY40_21845 [Phocaeicola vulgatus]|nr:hypothetical protein [Phocaeicola vulgatus]